MAPQENHAEPGLIMKDMTMLHTSMRGALTATTPDAHLICVLDIGYIRGHTGHQTCRAELINRLKKEKSCTFVIDSLSQITGQTGGMRWPRTFPAIAPGYQADKSRVTIMTPP